MIVIMLVLFFNCLVEKNDILNVWMVFNVLVNVVVMGFIVMLSWFFEIVFDIREGNEIL